MPAQRNFEVALKDYVDRLFSLEQSERDKDYQSLSKQINQIADGVDISLNVSGEGSGLTWDSESSSLAHTNKLPEYVAEKGQIGVGSAISIPTIRFDRNGHIIDASSNPADTEVRKNSMNVILSGAVYAAIEAEKRRAMEAEAQFATTGVVEENSDKPVTGDAVYQIVKALEERILDEDGKINADVIPEDISTETTWGNLEGDITQQQDLKQALDEKQNKVQIGLVVLRADNWDLEDGSYSQKAHIDLGDDEFAIINGGSVYLDWDPLNSVPYDLGILATSVDDNEITFIYPEESGPAPSDITISAMVM